MRIDLLTLFPSMFHGPFDESIVRRAVDSGALEVRLVDIRAFSIDRHRTVDDTPYGGGPGMVLKAPPVFAAVESVRDQAARVVLLTPQGRPFSQAVAQEYAQVPHLVLVCGHYEGFDERIRTHLVDEELSIGDVVLTGGELAAMVVVDAVTRLLPGVLGGEQSLDEESHTSGLLEYPQYTRPRTFRGLDVPEVLLSGNHARIAAWRRQQALRRTAARRPDLLTEPLLEELRRLDEPPSPPRRKRPSHARTVPASDPEAAAEAVSDTPA
ncbi:MAG: tRNA (guanosine(37)-N1)-methyltransferase TrmD [Chloroflexi bacterium]|nr:tRNA (guanosine(37)-N1)-methyltransferase TrmD [Chloroflexota bacterium]